jgi:hypothetical protein
MVFSAKDADTSTTIASDRPGAVLLLLNLVFFDVQLTVLQRLSALQTG